MHKFQLRNAERRNRSQNLTSAAGRRGFTLTELLIVMAILVLLVSLIGPPLLGSKQKADINSVKTQIGMFQSALERYAVDMNKFPSTEEGLAALVMKPGADGTESSSLDSESSDDASADDGTSESGGSSWDGPYLKTDKLPSDPWGKAYSYEYPPTHNKINLPDIWSFGPDGQENTEDDIVSWSGKGEEGSERSASEGTNE
ncbi:MAG: type II secretion system protein GspG [Planctomycetaceae bacterium]|nr:type II secretion system protein GspG [Planctomycetaceae bacterium]